MWVFAISDTPCKLALAWACALICLCCSVAAAHGQPHSAFELDSGLRRADVQDWSEHAGSSHYRMRIYRFRATADQITAMLRGKSMHLRSVNDPFDQATTQLFDVVRPPSIKVRSNTHQRSWQHAWGLFELLPPYAQSWVGCYPQPPEYAFRLAVIHPPQQAGSLQEVLLAAGGDVPQAAQESACRDSSATFYMPMAAMLNPAADRLLPFPFAARSFAEMVTADVVPEDLHYHGTFFVDSSHYFRFDLDHAAFVALTKSKSMQALPQNTDTDAHANDHELERLSLDWWLPTEAAQQLQWFELCQVLDNTPQHIRAAWHEQHVYWFTSGLSGLQPGAQSCADKIATQAQ